MRTGGYSESDRPYHHPIVDWTLAIAVSIAIGGLFAFVWVSTTPMIYSF